MLDGDNDEVHIDDDFIFEIEAELFGPGGDLNKYFSEQNDIDQVSLRANPRTLISSNIPEDVIY